jgi:nitrogen-specific signal transduction histidine kinase
MNNATTPILAALIVQVGLGLVVFQANRKRHSNQCVLILSLTIACWLGSLYFAFLAKTPLVAERAIRAAFAAGTLIPAVFNILRLSILERKRGWPNILRQSRVWLLITAAVLALCLTKFFLSGAMILPPTSHGPALPRPIYGPGIWIHTAFFAIAILALIFNYIRDLRRTGGGERAELAFILIGATSTLVFSILTNTVLRFFIEPSQLIWFAPFRGVVFGLVIAYGIATRKLMDVGLLLRRIMSYALLTAYLLSLYAAVWWLVATVLGPSLSNAHSTAHITAAVVVAFAMAPARGISQRLAERLFISSQQLDFRATVSKATEILSSITTLQDLLHRFAGTIAEAVGAESVLILLPGREAFTTSYAFTRAGDPHTRCQLGLDEPVTNYLKTHREPVVLDELYRVRPTAEVVRLSRRLRELNIALAMGIFSREQLAGIMLLGPRVSGRIYGSEEQNALQVLCGQLAVAIDNAQLFTEVQNAKIYNETLLQNLTTGVIAAGVDERVTVFNNEAGQITEADSHEILDQSIERLPLPLRDALRETLRSGGQKHLEFVLESGMEGLAVRASTSIFHGQDGEVLGALMVLTDVTALKRLELQIRRSDRLASLGTLSAGMAHEIKNPLVSIKTFAQLLPERYHDSDFRETFSNLIGHEIDRIDSLVNQLLRFARPAKPLLQPMHVHQILEKSLLLVGHRLYQKDIKLTRSWEANVDTIRADPDQLEQVFLNFFINAMDAMKNGGELNISTQLREDEEWISPLTETNGETREFLRITIRDSGEGIRGEDLAHVFDPFFTTKDYGTGLGLSVVHGIIQEHGGQIEVESELKKGTAFHILLPLVRFDSEVVAA